MASVSHALSDRQGMESCSRGMHAALSDIFWAAASVVSQASFCYIVSVARCVPKTPLPGLATRTSDRRLPTMAHGRPHSLAKAERSNDAPLVCERRLAPQRPAWTHSLPLLRCFHLSCLSFAIPLQYKLGYAQLLLKTQITRPRRRPHSCHVVSYPRSPEPSTLHTPLSVRSIAQAPAIATLSPYTTASR